MFRSVRRTRRPTLERLDGRCLLSALSPAQVLSAYGLTAVTFNVAGQAVTGNGSGQTIALIEAFHDPYLQSDLNAFDAAYHLAGATLTQVDLAGGSTDSGWASEATLDVEWAHAIAPGANLVVVEARSDRLTDLLAAVNVAKGIAGVSVVSMSWGGSEASSQTADDAVFTTPSGHTGITYVAATGDQGTRGGAEWPASSANVLAVGGTTLRVSASGIYQSESLWSGTSGGVSRFESEPSYQRSSNATGKRKTPDVAFDADPNSGVSVYTTDPATGRGAWQQVGGTSLGAPAWAAIVAIADQGRVLSGKGTLDSASQTMAALYSLPAKDFHKIRGTTGSGVSGGLGSPNGVALLNSLVGYGGSSVHTVVAAKHHRKKAKAAALRAERSAEMKVLSDRSQTSAAVMHRGSNDQTGRASRLNGFDAALEQVIEET